MKQKHFLVVPMLMASSFFALSGTPGAQAQDILPQGTFDQAAAGNKSGGWEILWAPEKVSLAGDAGNRWVQLGDGAALNHALKLLARVNRDI